MELPESFLAKVIQFISSNPPFVLAMFILSFFANVIQVGTYIRDRQRLQRDEIERQQLTQLVNTYEDVLKIAKETVQDKDKLAELKKEIRESTTEASRLAQEISLIEKTAQKKLVSQALEYNLGVLNQAYQEILDLQQQYKDIGELPNISPENIKTIESQVELALHRPYEFPKEFVFRSVLLVLFIMLLPWPVDTLLLPFIVRYFVLTFFDSVWLFPNLSIKTIVIKHYSLIIFFAVFGVWFQFFNAIGTFIIPVLNSMIMTQYNLSEFSIWNTILVSLPSIFNMLPVPLALLSSAIDWRYIRDEIKEKSIPKIKLSMANTTN